MGQQWKHWQTLCSWAPKPLQMVTAAMKLKDYCSLEEKLWQPSCFSLLKSTDITANKGLSSQSYSFSNSHVWIWELDHKKGWVLKNWCFRTVVLEKTLESPMDCKEIKPINPKGNQSWILNTHWKEWWWSQSSKTLASWCEEVTHWKRTRCWERLKAEVEGDNRGWDGWMASPTQWTWVWASSWSWWWTGKPGMLQSMGLQRVRHDWATELNWSYF